MPTDMAVSQTMDIDPSRRLSLRYFNLFRLVVGGLFLVAGSELNLGADHAFAYNIAAFLYVAAVLTLGFPEVHWRFGIDRVIMVQGVIDLCLLAAIMWASGGYRSGLPVLMMVTLAGAGLVAEGRTVLFFAALTTVLVLAENVWRSLYGGLPADFFQVGLACIGFFGIAVVARLLALRAKANASLAAERGQALARQQAVNERIIRDMQDGVIVVDEQGRARQANPQASALLGLQAVEGLTLVDIDAAFAELLVRGTSEQSRLLRLGPGGRLLRCRTIGGEPDSAAVGETLIYLTDFEEVQRQMQQLKLAALGRLTASMAHEIRNPLSAVTQAAELLTEEKRTDVQLRLARIIHDNANRIERMVRDVLALGRREQAEPEALPLASFVAELVDAMVLCDDSARAVFAIDIDPSLTLAVDRAHLHQILDNLLVNARRYCSGQPGALRVEGEVLPGGRVAVHVRDDGPGVDEKALANLFEPFFTTHPKGTGLGLYIARELAEANDATLDLRPEDVGAHFVLTGNSRP